MAMDDFNQSLSLCPELLRSQLHADGSVTVQVQLCDANDEDKVLGNRGLTIPASGNVVNDKGEDCGAPSQGLLDAIAAFKSAIESLVNSSGQAGKLDI